MASPCRTCRRCAPQNHEIVTVCGTPDADSANYARDRPRQVRLDARAIENDVTISRAPIVGRARVVVRGSIAPTAEQDVLSVTFNDALIALGTGSERSLTVRIAPHLALPGGDIARCIICISTG